MHGSEIRKVVKELPVVIKMTAFSLAIGYHQQVA